MDANSTRPRLEVCGCGLHGVIDLPCGAFEVVFEVVLSKKDATERAHCLCRAELVSSRELENLLGEINRSPLPLDIGPVSDLRRDVIEMGVEYHLCVADCLSRSAPSSGTALVH